MEMCIIIVKLIINGKRLLKRTKMRFNTVYFWSLLKSKIKNYPPEGWL